MAYIVRCMIIQQALILAAYISIVVRRRKGYTIDLILKFFRYILRQVAIEKANELPQKMPVNIGWHQPFDLVGEIVFLPFYQLCSELAIDHAALKGLALHI